MRVLASSQDGKTPDEASHTQDRTSPFRAGKTPYEASRVQNPTGPFPGPRKLSGNFYV